jgi:Tol biopolymer transport system component
VDVSRSLAADTDAVIAPDGRLMAFLSDRTGKKNARIYLSRPDGTGLRLLPAPQPGSGGGYDFSSLAFSPDGTRLLVAVHESA